MRACACACGGRAAGGRGLCPFRCRTAAGDLVVQAVNHFTSVLVGVKFTAVAPRWASAMPKVFLSLMLSLFLFTVSFCSLAPTWQGYASNYEHWRCSGTRQFSSCCSTVPQKPCSQAHPLRPIFTATTPRTTEPSLRNLPRWAVKSGGRSRSRR